jgi:hypothetical protein
MQTLPDSHKARLWIIGGLIAIAVAAFFLVKGTVAKAILGGAVIILLAAFGMEASKTDYNVGTLIKTGSLSAAKIQRDERGNITNVEAFCNAKDADYNCSDFKSQPEAQGVYDKCKGLGKNMDVYHLDGNHNGKVCESLPAMAH